MSHEEAIDLYYLTYLKAFLKILSLFKKLAEPFFQRSSPHLKSENISLVQDKNLIRKKGRLQDKVMDGLKTTTNVSSGFYFFQTYVGGK